jgi:hypothetical protein
MHLARNLGGVGKVRGLLDGKGVHVGPKADHPVRGIAPALDDSHDPGLAEAGHHLVAAEALQLFGDDPGRAVHVEHELGVLVQVATEAGQLLEVGREERA